jgi:hypothetical protein
MTGGVESQAMNAWEIISSFVLPALIAPDLRNFFGAALTSTDPEERFDAAGWAADLFFCQVVGKEPDHGSEE